MGYAKMLDGEVPLLRVGDSNSPVRPRGFLRTIAIGDLTASGMYRCYQGRTPHEGRHVQTEKLYLWRSNLA